MNPHKIKIEIINLKTKEVTVLDTCVPCVWENGHLAGLFIGDGWGAQGLLDQMDSIGPEMEDYEIEKVLIKKEEGDNPQGMHGPSPMSRYLLEDE